MTINYCVKNDEVKGRCKFYYFDTFLESFDFAYKKCKRDKRNVAIFDCDDDNGFKIVKKKIYLFSFDNGKISLDIL